MSKYWPSSPSYIKLKVLWDIKLVEELYKYHFTNIKLFNELSYINLSFANNGTQLVWLRTDEWTYVFYYLKKKIVNFRVTAP